MLRTVVMFLLLISGNTMCSQVLKVIYDFEYKELQLDLSDEKNREYKEFWMRSQRENALIAKNIDFVLIADKQKYSFTAIKPMVSDYMAASVNLAVSAAIDGESIHGNFRNKTSYYIPQTLPFVRSVQLDGINWRITKESKQIAGVKCYKAVVIDHKDDYKSMIPTVAWFAPSISFQGGPTAYASLPGVILELETFSGMFTAKKIKEGSFLHEEFNPKNKKIKTHKEFVAYHQEWNEKNMPRQN